MLPASEIADEIVSATNIVTCGGYYECDPVAVEAVIQRDREELVREIADWLMSIETYHAAGWHVERKYLAKGAATDE